MQSTARIRFQDCDPYNHLNNSKYIDYFINAREDQLIEYYDLNVYEIVNQDGLGWVVGSNQITYLNPANTMETVLIESQLISYSSKNLLVEMRMWDRKRLQLKSVIWITFVHFHLSQKKAVKHSKEFMDLFHEVILPVEQDFFKERSRFLAVKYARAT